jgi:tRNA threonylcarbamoyl adenosine modification protein YeaZ
MAWIGIDTATHGASVALLDGRGRTEVRILSERGAHARDLLGEIDGLLRSSRVARGELRGIGVALGPGSFTGVRVGMATGKGLAMALDIPLVGLSTLEAIARAAAMHSTGDIACLCAVLAAGRGEIYAARFGIGGDKVRRLTADGSWSPDALRADLPAGTVVARDSSDPREAEVAVLEGLAHLPVPPRAVAIAHWTAAVVGPQSRYRFGAPAPNYIRPSDAQAGRGRA